MRYKYGAGLAALALLAAAVPALAHHAVQSQFDMEKAIQVTGVITKLEWINPHSYMFVDVKDETGKVKSWALELLGPGGLRKAGLSREVRGGFKVGETITVHAFPSRDGSDSGYVKEFNLSDGRTINTSFLDPGAR